MTNSDQTDSQLNPKQIKALAALLTGKTRIEAAKAAGVSRQTITNWLQDSTFRQALADGEAELMAGINRRLLLLAEAAVGRLEKVLKRPRDQRLAVRASDIVLRRLLQIRELTEIEERLLELERRLEK